MVESVTMSLALGIIAVVIAVMAITSALKWRARAPRSDVTDPSYRVLHPDGWHAAEATIALRSREAS